MERKRELSQVTWPRELSFEGDPGSRGTERTFNDIYGKSEFIQRSFLQSQIAESKLAYRDAE